MRAGVLAVHLQDLGEDLRGRLVILLVKCGLRLGDGGLDLLGHAALAAQAVHELLQLAFGQSTHEAINRLAVDEGIDRGDRLDAHLLGELLVLVHVDLHHADLAIGLAHNLFECGAQSACRGRTKAPRNRR